MKDFLQYVLNEVKNKRLEKMEAMDLIRQFQKQHVSTKACFLHPMLHQNTSDLLGLRFSSNFTGQEFFLGHHVVKGQRILPGVAYLEMTRAAIDQIAGTLKEEGRGIRLRNVVWARPIVVGDQPVQMHIELFMEDNEEVSFKIVSEYGQLDAEPLLHCQGNAVLSRATQVLPLDINLLQAQCTKKTLNSSQCYEIFKRMGIDYGPGYQGIDMVYVGEDQVLVKLVLPSSVSGMQDQFILHPSLMDAALQAFIAVMIGNDALKPVSPAKLQEIEILSKCTSSMWAFIQYSNGSKAGEKVQILDITLCDAQGIVCVQMKGLNMQENAEVAIQNTLVSASSQRASAVKAEENFEMMTFEETWQEEALINTTPNTIKTMVCFLSDQQNQQTIREELQKIDSQTKVIFISQGTAYQKIAPQEYMIVRDDLDTYRKAFQSIQEEYCEVDALLYLWELEDPSCIEEYTSHVYILQAMAGAKLLIKRLLSGAQFANGLQRCYLESWIGFERSLGLVLPNTQVAVIYQEVAIQKKQERVMSDWLKKLWAELQADKIQSALYENGKRYAYQVRSTTLQVGDSPLRAGGTYLITGGCGGLGLLFAKHFAKKHPVNLILTGRSAMDADKQRKIKVLEALGSQVVYVQADVCDARGMKEGLHAAQVRFGKLHGVIHAAGIEGKEHIFEKELGSFEQVIAPKIQGTLVLDELLKEEALDFMCYFSSSSAILGDFGACDYAVGNRFLMAYAHYRKEQGCRGKTFVINWPLWKDGGMAIGEQENTEMYLKTSGQRFLEVEEGVNMLEKILTQSNTQYLVMVGKRSRIYRFLGVEAEQALAVTATVASVKTRIAGKGRRTEMKGLSIKQCVEWDLKDEISQLLKIPRDKLDLAENLADFGFDSISLAELAKALTNHYGIEISPAVFFGHSTIDKLTHYLMTEHQATIDKIYLEEVVEEIVMPSVPATVAAPHRQRTIKSRFVLGNTTNYSQPIAIIGMSGRFPQARNIDELWAIIRDGRDVVQEISTERFIDVGLKRSQWRGGWVQGVSEFDPLFFEISPKEAENMDPRQRLLLQEAWKALEDAGYGTMQIKTSKIGMFVGVEEGDYHHLVQDKGSITSNHNAILAARLSYFLNLNGPNMAINTACSSGLVATHQACQSLRNQECDTAIAAGVSLMLTPEGYIGMSQAGMLSEDGKCYAFDKRANGMVPGEAVAVVVLKRLDKAKADGDPIYAVIQGSGINYDGKTNGITAPSGVSQTQLLKSVYEQCKVNPEEIEYIVTHGTGTKLGDPIEINALYDAFKGYTHKQGYCALTSTKTNIGHTLAASGLVNLISLVQAFRHETIPASLHCEQENDYINWQKSPFFVNKENKPWRSSKGKERIGAVSAFGMGGTNVHMVVQSYTEENGNVNAKAPYYLLALSAKTSSALQQKVQDMIKLLENKDLDEKNLAEISYTLLEGRKHFEHRCAVVVQDREVAVYTLKQAGGTEKLPNLFTGKVGRDFTGQKAIAQYAQDLLTHSSSLQQNQIKYQETLYALADLYCQGYALAWGQLYSSALPRRISLPSYPFDKEHYWANTMNHKFVSSRAISIQAEVIHPLLHKNTSDLSRQQFSSTFTGQEFFLADHVVTGQKVLPGVAYLEMAREAVQQAAGAITEDQSKVCLKNVVWTQPIVVGEEPVQVHIGLYPENNGEIAYEIYSEEEVVHSQGNAVLSSIKSAPILDIKAIRAECTQGGLTSAECYEVFKAMGLNYGPGYQGIEGVYIGEDQVLAKLALPSCTSGTQEQFTLHPSLMDSALQSSIGLMMLTKDPIEKISIKPALPFALEKIEIIGKCTSAMWALIRYTKGSKADDKLQKINVDLCDEQGNVCVRMKGFSSRVLEGEVGTVQTSIAAQTLIFEPGWKEQPIQDKITHAYAQRVVLLCERGTIYKENIESSMLGVRCLTLQAEHKEIDKRFQSYAVQVFAEIKTILQSKPKGHVLVQIVISFQGEQELFAGLAGLLRTAQLENPKFIGQLIEVGEDSSRIVEILTENSQSPVDRQIRYSGEKRLVYFWNEIPIIKQTNLPWKDHGIYLITGGAGGLGQIFAREIAHKVKDATLILTGRSPLNEAKKAQLKELESLGARIEYQEVDVTKQQAVRDLLQNIQEKFGTLTGIIHGAGIFRDNFILKKTTEELQAVLAPKVTGLVNLDLASRNLPLDFFILFSSIAASLGNPGQADYSTANAFMDAYAQYRNNLIDSGERQGRTLSINWPLWREGGMHIDAEAEKMMGINTGMTPMKTSTGIQALYQGVASIKSQVMVIEGNVVQLRGFMEFNEIENLGSDFYQTLVEKVINSQLSTEQFKDLVMIRRGG